MNFKELAQKLFELCTKIFEGFQKIPPHPLGLNRVTRLKAILIILNVGVTRKHHKIKCLHICGFCFVIKYTSCFKI